jgi:4-hydroxybenzoate polyprenyltransferase
MIVYISTLLVGFFIWCFVSIFIERILVKVFAIVILVFLTYVCFNSVDQSGEDYRNSWKVWRENMVVKGCKRSSFVATKTEITPVWTCPDGTAHLDHG